jgi:hypothetical protein
MTAARTTAAAALAATLGDADGAGRDKCRLDGLIAVLVTAQKLLPPRAAGDVPLALAIVAFGILIIMDPSSVPGLTPPM